MVCVHVKLLQSCLTLCNAMVCSPPRLLYPWDSPGKNTGVGCHALLQGIFPTQGLTLHLLSPTLAGEFFTSSTTWKAHKNGINDLICKTEVETPM